MRCCVRGKGKETGPVPVGGQAGGTELTEEQWRCPLESESERPGFPDCGHWGPA